MKISMPLARRINLHTKISNQQCFLVSDIPLSLTEKNLPYQTRKLMKALTLQEKIWFQIHLRKKLIFPTWQRHYILVSSSNFGIQDCPACVLNCHKVHQPFNCFRGNYQLFNISHKQSTSTSYPLWNKAENTVMWLSWETNSLCERLPFVLLSFGSLGCIWLRHAETFHSFWHLM